MSAYVLNHTNTCTIDSFYTLLPFVQRTISGMNDRQEGMHDLYESTTEFQRAFYNVIACPWTCTVTEYKNHFIVRTDKNTAYPKIVSSKYRR